MRQIGAFEHEQTAQRFAAYLITQGIPAHAERDEEEWTIWVREEDHLESANRELAKFNKSPNDARYSGVEKQAQGIRRDEIARREKAQKNVVEMRSRWGKAAGRRQPLTVVVIILCVLVAMLTRFGSTLRLDPGSPQAGPVIRALLFLDPVHEFERRDAPPDQAVSVNSFAFRVTDVARGQVWRTVTPAFVHYGIMHLAFNMWMFWAFGGPIERRYGTFRFGLLVLALAIPSSTIGSVVPLWMDGSPFGAGMSGVIFGLFGLLWMKSTYDPGSGFHIPRHLVIFVLVYFFAGVTGLIEMLLGIAIGNWAHGVGLVCGIAIGYFPVMLKSIRRR